MAGIVTAVFQGRGTLGGFFVQERDADADDDPRTSEGIFVYDGTPVKAGDRVRVVGTAGEYHGNTQISRATVRVLDRGNPLPSAVSVSLPFPADDYLERYEGMRVVFPQTLTVTRTFALARYGEIELSSGGRLLQPTDVAAPGPAARALQAENDRNRIVLDDGRTTRYPDPAPFGLSAANPLRGGDTITGLAGILHYAFGRYRIWTDEAAVDFVPANPRPAEPPATGGSLRVAGFNLFNYFTTFDTGRAICGPSGNLECRGARNAAEFARQRRKIVAALAAMDADIAGLMELENTTATGAIRDLVDGLNATAGAGTYAFVDTGIVGTDAIRVGLIYRPKTVKRIGAPAILDRSAVPAFDDGRNRPSLAQTFEEVASGERFTVAVNHFKSKASDCDAVGDPDTGDGQGHCNRTRRNAARALVRWLATDPTGSGDPDFLLIGDFNAYAREDPVAALEAAGYANLAPGHSHVFEGQWGALDHALANASLLPQVAGAARWHINADEPPALDYRMAFKSAGQKESLYAPDPFRSSDHDPVLVGLDLGRDGAGGT